MTSAHQITEASIDDFTRLMVRVPCEVSAQSLLDWLGEDAPNRKYRFSQVARWCMSGDLPIYQLQALAEVESREIRELVLPAIRARATPERRVILERLLEDEDEGIRAKAEGVKAELEGLRRQIVPLRDA